MPLQILNPITYPGWDELVLASGTYSFFHSAAWAKVLAESYGYTPLYFTIIENRKLQALLPIMEIDSFLTGKRGVSLPFTDFCEPIISDGIPFNTIWGSVIEYGKKRGWKYFELRGGQKFLISSNLQPPTLGSLPPPSNLQPIPSCTYFVHTLDLTQGEDVIFKNLRDSTRRNIKKAQSQGVRIEFSTTKEGMEAFCRLNALTRKRHGLPAQPSKFFKYFYEEIILNNKGMIALALYREKPIACNIFCFLGKHAVYKYGASDLRFQNLRANNFLMWESIKWLIKKGFESLNLGRTEINNQGLRQFKSGWGTEEMFFTYFFCNFKKNTFRQRNHEVKDWQRWIFSRLPVSILNILGNIIYRHIA